MSDKLCPFCGDRALFDVNVDSYCCMSCDIQIHRLIWQQRTPPPSIEKVLESARGLMADEAGWCKEGLALIIAVHKACDAIREHDKEKRDGQ